MSIYARGAERTAQVFAALATAIFLLYALVYLYFGHWPVTHQDFWRIYDICLNRSWLDSALPKFNNHSLFFPSFFWLADLRLFHGSEEPLFYAGMTLLFFTAALLLIPIWRAKDLSLTARLIATLIVVVGTFWMGRASSIASPGFTCIGSLSLAGTMLAFLYLPEMSANSARSWKGTLIVLGAGFVASFSSSSGLATWPVLLLLGWCIRLPWRSLAIVALGAVAACVIFALLPDPSHSAVMIHGAFSSFAATSALPRLCRLLGSPILSAKAVWTGEKIPLELIGSSMFSLWCGAIGLILTAIVTVPRLIQRDLRKGGSEFIALALLSFILLVMFIIVVGRSQWITLMPFEVAAPRYFFWSTLFWVGLFMVIIERAESRQWLRWLVFLIALALPVLAFPLHYQEGLHWSYASYLAESAATGLINGVREPQQVKILFRDPDQVYRVATQLRAHRLDMFADGLQDWIGRSEIAVFDNRAKKERLSGNCRAEKVVQYEDGAPGIRMTGWARKGKGVVPKTLVITDVNGLICGVARSSSSPNKLINRLFYLGKFPGGGFVGYIKNYDGRVPYVARSADDGTLSNEKIAIAAPPSVPATR